MSRISAAFCHAFGNPFVIEDIEIRTSIDCEVEVNFGAFAICHSDIIYAKTYWDGSLPAVYGHKAAGTVTANGPNTKDVKICDKVVVTLIQSCGTCLSRSAAWPTNFEETYNDDQGPIKTANSGKLHQEMACDDFTEKVAVNASQVVTLPNGISMEAASLLTCGVITGIDAVVNTTKVHPSLDIVVIGTGSVGMNAIRGAKIAIAHEFGTIDAVFSSTGEPWHEAKAIMGQSADAILGTGSVATVYDQAPLYPVKGGKVIMIGLPASSTISNYEAAKLAASDQGMIGSKMGDVVIKLDVSWMVDLYNQCRLKLDELVFSTWSLDLINKAITNTKIGAAKRNLIVF